MEGGCELTHVSVDRETRRSTADEIDSPHRDALERIRPSKFSGQIVIYLRASRCRTGEMESGWGWAVRWSVTAGLTPRASPPA